MAEKPEPTTLLEGVAFDAQGLVPVIAQEAATGQVRMFAWANREALEKTLASRQAHFWSRSRGKLWRKGEESGHTLAVREVRIDCDGDVVLYIVDPAGPSCHTGATSCFFRAQGDDGTRDGFDLALTRAVADRVPVPVIASGGVGTLEHLYEGIAEGHAEAVLAASIFHFGEYTVEQAHEYLRARGVPVRDRVHGRSG